MEGRRMTEWTGGARQLDKPCIQKLEEHTGQDDDDILEEWTSMVNKEGTEDEEEATGKNSMAGTRSLVARRHTGCLP